MNASALAVMVAIGSRFEAKTIENLVRTADLGAKYGIPTLGVTAVGKELTRDARYLSLACRICAENGATFVKTYYCERDFEKVVATCPVPIVIAGGKKLPENEALDLVFKAIALAVLTPATLLFLRWMLSLTEGRVIADVDIATFLVTTPKGLAAIFLAGAFITTITFLEMACLMAIGLAASRGIRIRPRTAFAFGASRTPWVLALAGHIGAPRARRPGGRGADGALPVPPRGHVSCPPIHLSRPDEAAPAP